MIPSVDLIRVKNNMLNTPFQGVTLIVVIACIEHKVFLEAFRAALVKHDNNMKDYFGGWLITT